MLLLAALLTQATPTPATGIVGYCRFDTAARPWFHVIAGDPGKVILASPLALMQSRRVPTRRALQDLRRFQAGLSRAEAGWFLRGYLGTEWADRRRRRSFLRVGI